LKNLRGKGTREETTNNQDIFSFLLLKRNKMQLQCNFVFSFYEQRKEGKEEERRQSKITETQQ
jgi:hypothetical protein